VSAAVAAARFAEVFILGAIALLIATFELGVAVDLVVTGAGYNSNWVLGLAYVTLVAIVGFRAATKRATLRRSVFELLAVDAVALPVTLAALSL